jgi:hypothetical protein
LQRILVEKATDASFNGPKVAPVDGHTVSAS